jgi:hypothetical protein
MNGDDNGADDLGVGDEAETVDLLVLDPKEWKVPSCASAGDDGRILMPFHAGTETRSLQSARLITPKI